MDQLRRHVAASIGALLILATFQALLETAAVAWVFAGQILPPYGFFPTQLYDFLAKIRYFADPFLAWLPALPDHFRAPGLSNHLLILVDLLPAVVATALVTGAVGGVTGTVVAGRRQASLRGYLWVWLAVGLAVHTAVLLDSLRLDDLRMLKQLYYRLRALVLDGTIIAVCVLAASGLLSHLLIGRSGLRSRLGYAVAAATVAAALVLNFVPVPSAVTALNPIRDTPASAEPSPYNILLISLDSLRADRVGSYGHDRDTTPRLDQLADEGARFANAIATSPWTLPTHLTMLTGRYQVSHGVVEDTYTLHPAVPTLGELLKQKDYATAGFVSAPYTAARYGYSRGMDIYEDLSEGYEHKKEARSAIVAPEITTRGIQWLREHASERFFLFLHYFDIHYNYIPPPPYDVMFDPHYDGEVDATNFLEDPAIHEGMDPRDLEHILALYDGEIRFTDDHVKRVLGELDKLGLSDSTLVIVVSDHGDEFFEHGFTGHHRTLYEEVLWVPLVIRFPGAASHAGKVVEQQATLVDIAPTILDAAGVEYPQLMEGRSLIPLLKGEEDDPDRPVYGAFFDKTVFNIQAMRRTRADKVIQHFNRILHPDSPQVELYSLADDPGEQKNLYDSDPEETRAALTELAAWLESVWRSYRFMQEQSSGPVRIEHDAETLERLRSLGYVGD